MISSSSSLNVGEGLGDTDGEIICRINGMNFGLIGCPWVVGGISGTDGLTDGDTLADGERDGLTDGLTLADGLLEGLTEGLTDQLPN